MLNRNIKSVKFKRSLLAMSVMALSSPGAVFAADAIEEVVIKGYRPSIENAQEIKRNADTVKDVISASDIGSLPDKSVTESAQRIPGVTIGRFADSNDPNHFADEGTGVLIRGLDRVRSEVNGRDSFSANPNGGLNFEDFSPEMLGRIEVVKNQTADLISGGIAGTVNLVTRKPFDSANRELAFSVKESYGDYREEYTPAVSGLYSDRWQTGSGEFGVLLAASKSSLKSKGDGVGVANYYSRGDAFIGVFDQWGALVDANPNSPLDGPALPGQPAGSVRYVPGQFSLRTADNDRDRTGVDISAQWKNTDETVLATLEHIHSNASLETREHVIGTQGQGFDKFTRFGVGLTSTENMPITYDSEGNFTSGIMQPYSNGDLPMLSSSRYNHTENNVNDTSFKLQLTPTDKLKIDIDVQHISADQSLKNFSVNATSEFRQTNGSSPGDAFVDLRGSTPKIEFVNPRFTDPKTTQAWFGATPDMYLKSAMDEYVDNDAKENSAKLDVEYQLDGVWKKVKSGVYYSDKDLTIRDTEYSNWGALNEGWRLDANNVPAFAFSATPSAIPNEWERVNFKNFYGGETLNGQSNFLFPKMSSVEHFLDFTRRGCENGFNNGVHGGISANSKAQTSATCYLASPDLGNRVAGTPFAPQDINSSNEKRTEFYVRGDFGFDDLAMPVKGNLGLRYINYKLESTGYTVFPNEPSVPDEKARALFASLYPSLAKFADASGQVQKVKGTDYSAVLPSLNVAVSVTDEVVMRFAASEGVFYPSLDKTRNRHVISMTGTGVKQDPSLPYDQTTNPIVDIVGVGLNGAADNPNLEPEKSTNLDWSTEWYFAKAGSLSLSVFNKDLKNIIRDRSFHADVTNQTANVTENVSFSGPANSGSGSIHGFEISYSQFYDFLPGIWKGLGLQLNYTQISQKDINDPKSGLDTGVRLDADGNPLSDARNTFRVFSGLPLPGYSDKNYNIVGMYENNGYSLRLAYNWRSQYMITARDANEFAPIYAVPTGYLDASFAYNINDNFKVGLEANNLLGTETKTKIQINQEGKLMNSLNFKTDTRYALFFKGSF